MNKIFSGHKRVNTGFYDHSVGPGFNAGAESYGFVKKFANPKLLLTGTGYIPARNINPLQLPQVFANPIVSNVGIGVYAGTPLYFSGLLNNDFSPASE